MMAIGKDADVRHSTKKAEARKSRKTPEEELLDAIFGESASTPRAYAPSESNYELYTDPFDLLFSPIMRDYAAKLKIYGVDRAEDIALLLTDIANLVEEKAIDKNRFTRGDLLFDALTVALRTLKESDEDADGPRSLPDYPPARYVPRKSGRASDFLRQHWGSYLEAGIMFRPDLKRLDPKLLQALDNEFSGRKDELRAVLPTKSDEVDARIAREFGGPVQPEKRKVAQSALRFAKAVKP